MIHGYSIATHFVTLYMKGCIYHFAPFISKVTTYSGANEDGEDDEETEVYLV